MLPYLSGGVTQNISDPTPSFSNNLLISKIVKVLHKIEKGQELNLRERGVLSRGKDLIQKIIVGARVIEEKGFDSSFPFPLEEGINAYGYALQTMKTLDLFEEAQESTQFFEGLVNQLEKIESSGTSKNEIGQLKKFFIALGDTFSGEIYRREYQSPKTFDTPRLM
jgi:hypothetical protein